MKEWLERNRGLLFFALVILVLAGIVLVQLFRPEPAPIILATATPVPQPEVTPTPSSWQVYVSGAVQQPDVYSLPPNSIVKDALAAAGGPSDDADLDRINLASRVTDGEHVYVPRMGDADSPVQPSAGRSTAGDKININAADAVTLEELPGIGPSLAQRIIDHRQENGPFARIEEVMEVSGIGPAVFGKIQDLIRTE